MLSRIDYVIDMLEVLQSELEVLSADEIYMVLEEVINVLIMMESDT